MSETYKMMVQKKHILHSGFFSQTLRDWHSLKTEITPKNLMYPVFIIESDDEVQDIPSMPGIKRYGVNKLKDHLSPLVKNGLSSILVFGVIDFLGKDEYATNADSPQNPVVRALPYLRQWFPGLIIACDVCLCPYSSAGHCGILTKNGSINNAKSIQRIAEIALVYAKAGAHIIAPSDMMDGRIGAIKSLLITHNLQNTVSVLSYSCKFASNFYGPFRDVVKSKPAFGDRKCYQLPPGGEGLALALPILYFPVSVRAINNIIIKVVDQDGDLINFRGAHIIAPSDMMDGRIGAIKSLLITHNLQNTVSVLSYSCKFASNFYGPFRDVVKSKPAFGDRKCYQLPPGGEGLALRAVARDIEEGADFLMVKPIMAYMDILKQVKDKYPEYPMFVYQVSGEYAMILSAARQGIFDLKAGLMEILGSYRRSGADVIITYYTPLVLDWISLKHKL